MAGVADDDRDALARGLPGHRGLLREDLPDRGGGRQPVRLPRRGDRARLGDLAGLLPARDRGGVDVGSGRGARVLARGRAGHGAAGDRGRVAGGRRGARRALRPAPGWAGSRPSRWSARSRRSRSGSTPSRSSTSPTTQARRCRTCCRPGASFLRARLSAALCLPHALSPARPPPSTSRSSQWCAPWWRGPRRWGRCRRSRRRSRGRSGTGSAWSRVGSARRGRRARPGSAPAWCGCGPTGSGSAGECWW